MSWQELGRIAPSELGEARLALHHAAQVVASAGVTYLEPQPDDSHPNLGWRATVAGDPASGALVGRRLPGADVQVALRFADIRLLLLDDAGKALDELALAGKTLEDAYAWLEASTLRAGAKLPARSSGLTRASYEIPGHAIATGAAFAPVSPALAELASWFANAFPALEALATNLPGASEVRCWPHHFDVGGLAVVATKPDGSLAKSIGFGLSPGDEGYAEPYWYVSPWPYPDARALPELAGGGHWHSEGHTSAILTGTGALASTQTAQEQAARANDFLSAAVAASRHALEG